MRLLFCMICLAILSSSFTFSDDQGLLLQVDNIQQTEGVIWVGIYDSEENFLQKEKAIIHGEQVYKSGKLCIRLPDLPVGEYAIALFHDINNNGDLDRNFLGIPTEPFAFSGQTQSKWRIPRFGEVKFSYAGKRQILQTPLKRWYEIGK